MDNEMSEEYLKALKDVSIWAEEHIECDDCILNDRVCKGMSCHSTIYDFLVKHVKDKDYVQIE